MKKFLIILMMAFVLVGCGKREEVSKIEWLTNIPEPHRSLLEMRILTASMILKQGGDLKALPPLMPETQYYLDKEREAYQDKISTYLGK